MATVGAPQAAAGTSERPNNFNPNPSRQVLVAKGSRAIHHELRHGAQDAGGRDGLLETEKQIKLSEIQMENNDARTCGTNSVMGRANQPITIFEFMS